MVRSSSWSWFQPYLFLVKTVLIELKFTHLTITFALYFDFDFVLDPTKILVLLTLLDDDKRAYFKGQKSSSFVFQVSFLFFVVIFSSLFVGTETNYLNFFIIFLMQI